MSSPSDEPLASARSLLAGADAHYRTGSYREAAEAAAAAGALLMAALDPPPALVASALGAEGFFRYLLGEVAPARSLFEQELQIWERLGGENDPRVATTLNNLAMLFDLEGNYAAARPLMERVVSIRAAVLEPGHPDVVAALNNLALLEDSVGNAVAARGLWERALAGKPSDGDEVAAVLNNLAGLLVSQGDFDEARGLYTRALDIRKALYGPDHTLVAEVLVNEAALLRELGEGAKAAHALERVVSIWEKSKGSEHPDVAAARNSLAAVYSDAGAWERSRPLLEQVRGAWERRYGPSHPESVAATNNLALVLLRTGDAHGARELWEQALATRTAALSEGHPANVPLLFDLSIANLALGCEKEAREAALRAGRLSTRYARTVLPALSVAEQAAYLERHYGALASGLAPFLSDHEREAVELVLGRKGLLQEGLRRQNALTRISDGPLGEVARRLEEARLRVARTVRETAAAFREAERERERIERELAEALGASAAFGSETVRLADSWEDGALAALQAALPVHHAFVDVVEHDRYADAEGVRRYAAIVVGSNDWSVLDLGEGDAVDYAVQRWRRNRRQIEHVDALRKLLWRPLAAALPVSTTRIWIAPDGQLGRVPWAVLPEQAPTGDVRIAAVPSARALLWLLTSEPVPSGRRALIVGDVEYGEGGRWRQLPRAGEELRGVAALAREAGFAVDELSGREATSKDVARGLKEAAVAHVVTHGELRRDASSSVSTESEWVSEDTEVEPGRSPLLENWLVLAGANEGAGGRLTGEDIVGLALDGLGLLALSACVTGRGAEFGGEGALGLQAAAHAAGARCVLASLWKVPDGSTAALMNAFYRALWKDGMSPADALTEAQAITRANPERRAAIHWAGWVLSGDVFRHPPSLSAQVAAPTPART